MNGIIYCRVSSKEQIEGTSLESQEGSCKEYARSHGIAILKTFVELGESAKFADRTQLLELIDFCKEHKGQVEKLLVWKLDRFARNVGDHFNIKATLLKYGVRVVSVTEPIDANPEGKLLETILAGFAQFDNDIRATRTVQGMKRKLQEGIFPWRPPLGYKSSVKNDEKKTQPDDPAEPLFSLLQKAWKDFASGSYTKAEIGRLMTNRGILTSKGAAFSPQSLDNLFRNPFYAGTLVDPWSREEYEGKHIPMVTREVFAQVQQVISRRKRSVPHLKERVEFPLRGLVRCPECHHYMTSGLSRGRSKRYPYYCCRNSACGSKGSYRSDSIHGEFERFLDRIALRPDFVAKLEELVIQFARKYLARSKAEKVSKRDDLERLARQRQELIRMRTEGLITDHEFLAQTRQLSERRMATESRLEKNHFDFDAVLADLKDIEQPLGELRATWEKLSPALQQRFNRLTLPVGFIRGQIGTAERALIFSASGDFCQTNSTEVPPTGENLNRLIQEISGFAGIFRGTEEEKIAA